MALVFVSECFVLHWMSFSKLTRQFYSIQGDLAQTGDFARPGDTTAIFTILQLNSVNCDFIFAMYF